VTRSCQRVPRGFTASISAWLVDRCPSGPSACTELSIRPLFHQLEASVKAHIPVGFLCYELWVILKHILQRRQSPLTYARVLGLIVAVRSADIALSCSVPTWATLLTSFARSLEISSHAVWEAVTQYIVRNTAAA
jgi:hypothetical protein